MVPGSYKIKKAFLLVGNETVMAETFGSTMHDSGRTMSMAKAKKEFVGTELKKKMRWLS